MVRDPEIPAAADQRDLVSRLLRDLQVAREPVTLDRKERLGVDDADEEARAAVLGHRGDDVVEEFLRFLEGLAVEELGSNVKRLDRDAVPLARRASLRARPALR